MAEIKMDVSEYEAMQENKKLLEKALEKEEKLNKQIIDLKQEKIDSLKETEKKVVKIITRQTQEILLTKKPDHEIMSDLSRLFYDMNDPNRSYGYNPLSLVENMKHAFFQVEKVESIVDDSVTIHGLDEVKSEIRAELEKEVKDEVNRLKSSVKYMKQTEENNASDLLKVAGLKSEVNTLKGDKEKLEKEKEELEEDRKKFDELKTRVYEAINELNNDSLFTRGQTMRNAITILKSKK